MSFAADTVQIRRLEPKDKAAWSMLWRGYLKFYRTSRPPEIFDLLFHRLLNEDPRDGSGWIGILDSKAVGLAHAYHQRHGWYDEEVVYLQDLFTASAARGLGVGRKLIEAVYASADIAGLKHVYWTTETDNERARHLYDEIGEITKFIKYQRPSGGR